MRLIDADALKERLSELCELNCPYTKKQRDVMCSSCLLGIGMETMEDAPTIEERKTGKWIEPKPKGWWSYNIKAYAECSECGNVQFLGARMDYCPSCGSYNGGGYDGK